MTAWDSRAQERALIVGKLKAASKAVGDLDPERSHLLHQMAEWITNGMLDRTVADYFVRKEHDPGR